MTTQFSSDVKENCFNPAISYLKKKEVTKPNA